MVKSDRYGTVMESTDLVRVLPTVSRERSRTCTAFRGHFSPLSRGPLFVSVRHDLAFLRSPVGYFGAGPSGGACLIFPPTGSFYKAHVSPLCASVIVLAPGEKAPSPPGLYVSAAACLPPAHPLPVLLTPSSVLRHTSLFASYLPSPARPSLPLFPATLVSTVPLAIRLYTASSATRT